MVCVDQKMLNYYCKSGMIVNAKTGETMPTSNVARNANSSQPLSK